MSSPPRWPGICCLSVMLSGALVAGPVDDFEDQLSQGLLMYRNASSPDGVRSALDQIKDVARQHPSRWHAHYWHAYLVTQTARLGAPDKMGEAMDEAQAAYDTAWGLRDDWSASERSEFLALQHLIHSFRAGSFWRRGDQENGLKLTKLADQALSDAILANPVNPRVFVLTGTGLISDGNRTQDRSLVLAGKVLLQQAEQLFDAHQPASPIEPDWARDWIGHWLTNQTGLLTADSPQ